MKENFRPALNKHKKYRYQFHGNYYRFDELRNIAWGRLMGFLGVPPPTAMMGAGTAQMYEVYGLGIDKRSHFPFGDDIHDTFAIARGYWWWFTGR